MAPKPVSRGSYPAKAFISFDLIPKKVGKKIDNFPTTMAGAAVMPSYVIPGLHYDPTLADLEASSDVYVYNLF